MVRAHWNGVEIDTDDDHDDRSGQSRSFFDRFRRHPASDAAGTQRSDRTDGATSAVLHTSQVVDLDDESFAAAMDQHVTIIDFWAPWCGPCRQLHPLFDARAAEHARVDLRFARVNVDDSPKAAAAFNVMSIPTIIVFDRDGTEVEREIGLPAKRRLDQLVSNADSRSRENQDAGNNARRGAK